MSKPAKRCIFCGETGVTKEHVFPLWLREMFPRDDKSSHIIGTNRWSDIKTPTGEPIGTRQHRQGHPGTRTVRVVCNRCNNGWMSDLENAVIPILTPMIQGQKARLSPEAQSATARWAAKTVICAEQVNPRPGAIPESDRKCVKDEGLAPPNWHVWIVTYAGGIWEELAIAQNRGRLMRPAVASPNRINHEIHATIVGLRHLVFLVIGTSWEAALNAFRNVDRNGVVRIWPTAARSILWPFSPVMEDPQINALANVLTMSGAFNQSLNPGANWTFTLR